MIQTKTPNILLQQKKRLANYLADKKLKAKTPDEYEKAEIEAGNRYNELNAIESEHDRLLLTLQQKESKIQILQANIYRLESEMGASQNIQINALFASVFAPKIPYQRIYNMDEAYRRAESRTQFLIDNPDYARSRNLFVLPDPDDEQIWEMC